MNRRTFFGSLLAAFASASMAEGIAANIPSPPRTFIPPQVFLNGVRLRLGGDFHLAGDTLHFREAIPFGSTVICVYPLDSSKDKLGVQMNVVRHQGNTTTFNSSAWLHPTPQ